MHLRQSEFTYSVSGPFPKNKERLQKLKERADLRYIYQNELHKACFQHNKAYGDFKYWATMVVSDKILRHKVFNIAKNAKYDGYRHGLASRVFKFFDGKTSGGTVKT